MFNLFCQMHILTNSCKQNLNVSVPPAPNLPLDTIVSHLNSPPILTPLLPKMHINVILQSRRLYKWTLSKRFSHRNSVNIPCFSSLSHILKKIAKLYFKKAWKMVLSRDSCYKGTLCRSSVWTVRRGNCSEDTRRDAWWGGLHSSHCRRLEG